MTWIKELAEKSSVDGSYQYWESLRITQLESTEAGFALLEVTSRARIYPGGYTAEKKLRFEADGVTLYSESECPRQGTTNSYVSATVQIKIPSEHVGKTFTVYGRFFSWPGIVIDPYAVYTLTIIKNAGVASVTVERTASEAGTTGELANGAAIYTGDVLNAAAAAAQGYELEEYERTITVNGNVTVAPTAKQTGGTVNIYRDGKWQKHKLMIYRGGAWAQHKAVIYKGSAWSQYN